MITHLSGKRFYFFPHSVVLDVQGVGYEVMCSKKTLSTLHSVEASLAINLWVERVQRGDLVHIFGFLTLEEHQWFRLLLTVQGMGPRLCLKLFDVLTPQQLFGALHTQNKKPLVAVEGIGEKLALRLVTELKNKTPPFLETPLNPHRPTADSPLKEGPNPSFCVEEDQVFQQTVFQDVFSALWRLGYEKSHVRKVLLPLEDTSGEPSYSFEDLLRVGLSRLSER